MLFAANLSGHAQVYRLPAPGAAPERLVNTGDRMIPHVATSHGLVVRHDSGGNETWQLSLLDSESRLTPLTTDARAIHAAPSLRPDGASLGLSWNPGGQQDMVLGELLLPTGELRPWTTPGGYWIWQAWEPSGERAVVAQTFGSWVESHLLTPSGALTRILAGSRAVEQVQWSSAGLLVITDGGSDFTGLALIDPNQPEVVARWLVRPDHDVTAFALTPDGNRAAVVVNTGIHDQVVIVEMGSGEIVERPEFGPGVVIADHTGEASYHLNWDPDGKTLFVAWESPTRPADIVAFPGAIRWTDVNPAPPPDLREPVETSYASFDGLLIPAMHYRVGDQPRPTVCLFHGGPEGQARAGYLPIVHLLNGIGVNVLVPNVRGSTGYGFAYQSLDDKTLRWDSVRDGCAAARWLRSTGQATRIAAMGGSYGGFMTLAVLVEDPGLWDAAVDVVGIARWKTFFDNMPPWRGALRIREYGDPEGAEKEFLESISPIHRAHTITAPLLVVHGRNDPRVPVQESEQIAAAAGDCELLIFDNEGHGIARHENQVTYHRKVLEFLEKRLVQ